MVWVCGGWSVVENLYLLAKLFVELSLGEPTHLKLRVGDFEVCKAGYSNSPNELKREYYEPYQSIATSKKFLIVWLNQV